MKKVLLGRQRKRLMAILLMLLITLGTFSVEASAETDGEPIRIGLACVLSGSNAIHGKYCRQGAELWAKEVNDRGGILGRPVELVIEDCGETDQSRLNTVVKLLSEGDICALLTDYDSSQTTMVSPTIQEYQIPHLSDASSAAVLQLGNEYIWFNRMTDQSISPSMVNASKNLLGMKNPALIFVSDSYGQGYAEAIKAAIEADPDITLAMEVSCNADEKQYTPFLTQIVNSGADGIIAIHHQEQAALVMMQTAAMDIDLPKIGCSQYATALAFETAGDTANGWYSLADWSDETENPTGQAFLAAYQSEYGGSPDFLTVCSYDAGMILEDAITRAGSAEPADIQEALKETNGLEGAMAIYTYDGGLQSLAETINVTKTEDLTAKLVDVVTR